jgi:glycosyltransferase involved in cell wall biosynthesis
MKELGAWMAAGDAFVAPSRRAANGWVEAQGLSLIEAMIAGAPVIATRLGGVPDAVIDGQTGLLVDERSPEQIAAAVRRLYNDAQLARTLAEQGRSHAAAHFSRHASARSFADLFARLLSRPR